jgi:hypothetical protein
MDLWVNKKYLKVIFLAQQMILLKIITYLEFSFSKKFCNSERKGVSLLSQTVKFKELQCS